MQRDIPLIYPLLTSAIVVCIILFHFTHNLIISLAPLVTAIIICILAIESEEEMFRSMEGD